jgi:hypothetical protein
MNRRVGKHYSEEVESVVMKGVRRILKARVSNTPVSGLFVNNAGRPIDIKDIQPKEQPVPQQLLHFFDNSFDKVADIAKIEDLAHDDDIISTEIKRRKMSCSLLCGSKTIEVSH